MVLASSIAAAGAPRVHAAERLEPPAARDPAAAEREYEAAQQAYRDGEMLAAAAALERAYALDPRPMFLYQRGHALREAGSCRAAITAFEAFIAVATTPEDRAAAQEWVDQCRQVLAAEPEPEPATDEPLTAREPEPAASPSPPSRPDRWGWAGVGVGAGLVLGGAAMLGSSYAVAGANSRTESEPDYLARERRTTALTISGIALMSVGGAVLLAAGIRLRMVASRRRTATSSRLDATAHGLVLRF